MLRVWTHIDGEPEIEQWLVLRPDSRERKRLSAALCNAPADTPLPRLARMKCTRFWVEHSIQNAKSEIGMDELCAQNYRAWQHHIVLSMLALYFIEDVRLKWQRQYPVDPMLLYVAFCPMGKSNDILDQTYHYGDFFRRMRHLDIPGSEEQARRPVEFTFFAKTASSIAHLCAMQK